METRPAACPRHTSSTLLGATLSAQQLIAQATHMFEPEQGYRRCTSNPCCTSLQVFLFSFSIHCTAIIITIIIIIIIIG